jgi:hypothetical protein
MPPKSCCLHMKLHGVTHQKTVIFINTTLETSNFSLFENRGLCHLVFLHEIT